MKPLTLCHHVYFAASVRTIDPANTPELPHRVEQVRQQARHKCESPRERWSRIKQNVAAPRPRLTPMVVRVAPFLRAKVLVIIGGRRNRRAEARLIRAFGLTEVRWVETCSHQSIERIKPLVKRHEVAVVCVFLRAADHAFGALKGYCNQFGKLYVRLLSGYNPEQVAFQIVSQVGALLGMAQSGDRRMHADC